MHAPLYGRCNLSLQSTSGATFGELRARVQGLKTFTLALNVFGGVVAAWAYVWPNPSALPVYLCAILVPIALAIKLWSRSRIELALPRGEKELSLSVFYITPAIAIAARALIDATILDLEQAILWALVIGAGLTPIAVIDNPLMRRKPSFAFFLFVINAAYGFGMLVEMNDLLDASPAAVHRTQIINKSAGSGKIVTYALVLGSWGNMRAGWSVNVSEAAYRAAHIGDATCVYLRPGFFRFAHLNVGDCPA